MIKSEVNPNHPTTTAMREQWHKIAALLLQKLGGDVTITTNDIADLGTTPSAVVIETTPEETIRVRLVSMEEATRLAHKEGGLRQ